MVNLRLERATSTSSVGSRRHDGSESMSCVADGRKNRRLARLMVEKDGYAELMGRVRVADGKAWDRQPRFRGPIHAEEKELGKPNGSRVPGATRSSRAGACSGLRPNSMG
jgi:hypothetical protein